MGRWLEMKGIKGLFIVAGLLLWVSSGYSFNMVREFYEPYTGYFPNAIAVHGDYVYISYFLQGKVWVIDISDFTRPRKVNRLDSYYYFMAFHDNLGFTYGNPSDTGLIVLDMSDPVNPTPIGATSPFPINSNDRIEVMYPYTVSTSLAESLVVIDVSNPSNPAIISSLNISRDYQDFRITALTHIGNYIFLSASVETTSYARASMLFVVDLTDPTAPQVVYDTIMAPGYYANSMVPYQTPNGSYLYYTGQFGILVYELGDPTTPTLIDSVSTDHSLVGFVAYDTMGVAFDPDDMKLLYYHFSEPSMPVLFDSVDVDWRLELLAIKSYKTLATTRQAGSYSAAGLIVFDHDLVIGACALPYDTYFAGWLTLDYPYAYIISGTGLDILNISGPGMPEDIRTVYIDGLDYGSVVKYGNYLYAIGDHHITVVDVSEPENPIIVNQVYHDFTATLYPVLAFNGKLLVGHISPGVNCVLVFSLADPENPRYIGQIDFDGVHTPLTLAHSGNIVAFSLDYMGVELMDFSDLRNPVVISTIPDASIAYDVAIYDSLLYVATGSDSILVYNISNPYNPLLASVINEPYCFDTRHLKIDGHYLYAIGYSINARVFVFDLSSDPLHPAPAGCFTLTPEIEIRSFDVDSNTMFVLLSWEIVKLIEPTVFIHVGGDTVSPGQTAALPIHISNPHSNLAKVRFYLRRDVNFQFDSVSTIPELNCATSGRINIFFEMTGRDGTIPPMDSIVGHIFVTVDSNVDVNSILKFVPKYFRNDTLFGALSVNGEELGLRFTIEGIAIAPPVPAIIEPSDSSFLSGDSVTVIWNSVEGASAYELLLSDSSDFGSILDSVTTFDTLYTFTHLEEGIYYLKVRARSDSGFWSGYSQPVVFEIDRTPPGVPALISPIDGKWVGSSTVNFQWSAVRFKNSGERIGKLAPVHYVIEVLEHDMRVAIDTVDTNHWVHSLPEGSYTWRVRAFDDAGNQGGWSELENFGVDTTPPEIFSMTIWPDTSNFWGPFDVTAYVDDTLSGVSHVWLYWWFDTTGIDSTEMVLDSLWRGTIPASDDSANRTVSYFIKACDSAEPANFAFSDTVSFTLIHIEEGNRADGFSFDVDVTGRMMRIRLLLPVASTLRIKIYDIAGRMIFSLNKNFGSGMHELAVPVKLPNGLYLVRCESKFGDFTKKVIVAR